MSSCLSLASIVIEIGAPADRLFLLVFLLSSCLASIEIGAQLIDFFFWCATVYDCDFKIAHVVHAVIANSS